MSRRTSGTRGTLPDALTEDEVAADRTTAVRPSHQAVFVAAPATSRPSFDIRPGKGLYAKKPGRPIPALLRSPRGALATVNIVVLGYLLLRSPPSPPPILLSTDFTQHLLNISATIPILASSQAPTGVETCEVCVLTPDDPMCEYGVDNINLSRNYEGSGFRVRRFLEKALRGEEIEIAVIGASVTAGHGLEGHTKWQDRFLKDWIKIFPNTKMHTGALPGGNSEFFSYCFNALVSTTADLYLVELDINNEPNDGTPHDDDALYRGLLNLPQQPALIRLSVMALLFPELNRGHTSTLLLSQYFDVPVIGIRNFLLPHIVAHPTEAELFMARTWGEMDGRHIGFLSHRALGDMLALYLREQTCVLKRRRATVPALSRNQWPQEDILRTTPKQYLWTTFTPNEAIRTLYPSCELVTSTLRPLVPLPSSSKSWTKFEWNDKKALGSSTVGSSISLPFNGTKIGLFVWSTSGSKNVIRPGKAICSVDGLTGKIIDAYIPEEFSHSRFKMVVEDLKPGEHVLTCEILPDSSTDGHDFRILGIGSQ